MSAFDAIERADAHGRIAEYWRERADAAEAERDEWKTAAEYEQAKKLEYQREANAAEDEAARLRALLEEARPYVFHLSRCPRFAPDVIPEDPCTCGGRELAIRLARLGES